MKDHSSGNIPTLDLVAQYFGSQHPLFRAMGIRIVGIEGNRAELAMPCTPAMQDGRSAVHRGAMVTMLDNTCGLSIFAALGRVIPVATIDLRVDYLRPIPPGTGIRSIVECVCTQETVAFISGRAVTDDASAQLLATVHGTFAINTMGPKLEGLVVPTGAAT